MATIEDICESTWKEVYRYVYYRVQNREEAEDITQEAYVKAFHYLEKDSGKIDHEIRFLKTVSLNIIKDRWRKKKRHGQTVPYEDREDESLWEEDFTNNSTEKFLIREALSQINEDQRNVIELRIIKGYSVAETAKILKKKEGTIRVLQYRGLRELSEILPGSY